MKLSQHTQKLIEKAFQPGKFVMLHPNAYTDHGAHPDAGRVGKIVSCDKNRMVVEFFVKAEAISCGVMHKDSFLIVPDFHVEEYTKEGVTGYRVNDQFKQAAQYFGWNYTQQSEGIL